MATTFSEEKATMMISTLNVDESRVLSSVHRVHSERRFDRG